MWRRFQLASGDIQSIHNLLQAQPAWITSGCQNLWSLNHLKVVVHTRSNYGGSRGSKVAILLCEHSVLREPAQHTPHMSPRHSPSHVSWLLPSFCRHRSAPVALHVVPVPRYDLSEAKALVATSPGCGFRWWYFLVSSELSLIIIPRLVYRGVLTSWLVEVLFWT